MAMMVSILSVLALVLIKGSCSKLYIDLKINFMSEGVVVHHGTYSRNGSYQMFLGEKDPLERVYFGNARLYPPRLDYKDPTTHQLIVELFHTGSRRCVLVHNYSYVSEDQVGYGRIFFELGLDTYIEVDQCSFMSIITSFTYLSIDIGPKHRHPFIMRTVEDLTTQKKVTYKAIDSFNRIPFDGVSAPKYAIGHVYDTSSPIVIGYTKMDYLHDRCVSFTVDYKINAEKVTLKSISYVLIYERRSVLNTPVWYLVLRPEVGYLREDVRNALAVYEKLENHWEKYTLLTLDVSDNITPDLYGIEKIMGLAGDWKYALYQVKKEHSHMYAIKSIVDLTTQVVKIHKVESVTTNTTVEVYTSADDTIIIINTDVKNGVTYTKEIDVYEKSNTNFVGYSKMVEPAKSKVLESFKNLYPIKLGVVINDKPNSIYGLEEITGGEFNFLYFYLRESDYRGNDLRDKYLFGYIWEKDPYKMGNIPAEEWSKKTRVVNRELNTRKFMIRNTYAGNPVDVKTYEIYQLVQ